MQRSEDTVLRTDPPPPGKQSGQSFVMVKIVEFNFVRLQKLAINYNKSLKIRPQHFMFMFRCESYEKTNYHQ